MSQQDRSEISADTKATATGASDRISHRRFFVYFFWAMGFSISIYLSSEYVERLGPIGIAICTLIVSLPIMVNGAYHAAVSRILFLQGLNTRGILFKYSSGYFVRLMAHTILGLAASIVLVTEVIYTPRPHLFLWSSLLLGLLLLYPVYVFINNRVRREAKAWNVGRVSITIATIFVAIVTTVFYSVMTNFGTNAPIFGSIDMAVISQPQFSTHDRSIALLFDYYNQARGVAQYVFGQLRTSITGQITYLVFYEVMLFLFFFGIISAMSTFCFSFRELKRAVSKPDTNVMSTSWLSILLVSTIFLAVSAVYIYGFWGFSREVELVHDRLVRRGTVALLEQTKARYEDLLRQQLGEASSVSLEEMESAVDAIISAMRANADDFLDWYYGPRGEIFRTAQRTLGRLRSNRDRYEQRMAARLSEFLLQEVPVDAYHVQWESFHRIAESLVEVTVDQFNLERDQIIRANTIVSDVTGQRVYLSTSNHRNLR